MATKRTARMKAQRPCSEWCVGSRHLHLHPDDRVVLVGYGQWEDQYLSIWLDGRQVIIPAAELRTLARGIVMRKPVAKRKAKR